MKMRIAPARKSACKKLKAFWDVANTANIDTQITDTLGVLDLDACIYIDELKTLQAKIEQELIELAPYEKPRARKVTL